MFNRSNDVYERGHFNSMRILHGPLPCWTTWSSRSIYMPKTNIIVGNLPLFYWRIFCKKSLIEFASQICIILLFSVFVGDSIYLEVTRYTLKWWSKKIPSKYRFIFILFKPFTLSPSLQHQTINKNLFNFISRTQNVKSDPLYPKWL